MHFGEIKDHTVVLNNMGSIANTVLKEITNNHPNAILDTYVIMLNHIHCIIQLFDKMKGKGVACNTPYRFTLKDLPPFTPPRSSSPVFA